MEKDLAGLGPPGTNCSAQQSQRLSGHIMHVEAWHEDGLKVWLGPPVNPQCTRWSRQARERYQKTLYPRKLSLYIRF